MSNKKKYFDEEQEEAVIRFNSSDSQEERSKIYNEFLRAPMDKMVESIINRYLLHRKGIEFSENHSDTLSDIILKYGKFKPEKQKKAYSYYSAICRNYLIANINNDANKLGKFYDFDMCTHILEERDEFRYTIDDDTIKAKDVITNLIDEIKETIKSNEEGTIKKKLTTNEVKLGYALIEILSNPKSYFDDSFETPKYNKNTVLFIIREYTGLTTKDIRIALKRYKTLFKLIQNEMITDGSI